MLKKIAMGSMLIFMLISMCAVFVACGETEQGEVLVGVFFDSSAADGGIGTQASPFNDLDELIGIDLPEVDGYNIYLKRGSEWKQNLYLLDLAGSENCTLYVTDYGDESDPLPKIDGNDSTGEGVLYIRNCEYITIENLEIYDSYEPVDETDAETGANDLLDGKDKRGVMLTAGNMPEDGDDEQDIKFFTDITLQNLYIHDIRGLTDYYYNGGDNTSKACGGICVFVEDYYSSYANLTITGCDIENVDNVGISTRRANAGSAKYSLYPNGLSNLACEAYDDDFTDYAFRNVEISHNTIHNIGKNGIFLRNAYDSIIEHNTVFDTATRCFAGNQIITRSVYCVTVQYNEGYLNNARDNEYNPDKTVVDGSMLDPDLDSRDTIWQYNYSHDNAFGLLLNCTEEQNKVIVRNNLSVNDHGGRGLVYVNYVAKNVEIYNNTFITADDTEYIFQSSKGGSARTFNFYNNVVYNTSPDAEIYLKYETDSLASNNLIYNAEGGAIEGLSTFKGDNTNGIYTDPMLKLGVGETIEERTGYTYENLSVATPLEGSPVFDAGCDIREIEMGEDGDYVPGLADDMVGRAYSCYTLGCVSSVE